MTIYLQYGSITTTTSPLIVWHGGAGPQDPKGSAAAAADQSIRNVDKNLPRQIQAGDHSATAYLHLQARLDQLFPKRSEASLFCLQAAQQLEADPLFNAGLGAALQQDGVPRVSASFMDSNRKFSAVINGQKIRHPSLLAYFLQQARFPILDSVGTENLAEQLELPRENLLTERRKERWQQYQKAQGSESSGKHGTIGAVAIDAQGQLAAITSTGGVGNETVGRVGDTPTIAGNFCDGQTAVSCTGYGEQIINIALAPLVCHRKRMGQTTLEAAMRYALEEAQQLNYELAAIAVSRDQHTGAVEWAAGSTASYFVWATRQADQLVSFSDFCDPAP